VYLQVRAVGGRDGAAVSRLVPVSRPFTGHRGPDSRLPFGGVASDSRSPAGSPPRPRTSIRSPLTVRPSTRTAQAVPFATRADDSARRRPGDSVATATR